MTLRATIEIVPFGEEEEKYKLFQLDISNYGTVHYGAFGHDLCTYVVKVYEPERFKGNEMVLFYEFPLSELHNRRDGPAKLVAKAIDDIESGWAHTILGI